MAQQTLNVGVPCVVTSAQASTQTDNAVVPASTQTDNAVVPASTQAETAAAPTEISDAECQTEPVRYYILISFLCQRNSEQTAHPLYWCTLTFLN